MKADIESCEKDIIRDKLAKLLMVFEVPKDAMWLCETSRGVLNFIKHEDGETYFKRANTTFPWAKLRRPQDDLSVEQDINLRSIEIPRKEKEVPKHPDTKPRVKVQNGIAPHEGHEINMVMWGMKPLASIEFHKQPNQFKRAIKLSHILSVCHQDLGSLTVTLPENAHLHETFKLLSSPKASVIVRSKEEKHRLLGRLFGYTEDQINDFIKSDMQCACGQCRFES